MIPALEAAELMKNSKNMKIVENNADCISVQIVKGSNKIVRIPLKVSRDLAYITAALICDGHIRKDKYRIWFENINEKTVKKLARRIGFIFDIDITYRSRIDKRGNRKRSYYFTVNSKPLVLFLNHLFDIPRGKKSNIVGVPKIIKKSNINIKRSFIEGVFDTDGGKRRRGYGLSSASIIFRDDVSEILNELDIVISKDEWINKKYNKKYYGLYFNRKCLERIRKNQLKYL